MRAKRPSSGLHSLVSSREQWVFPNLLQLADRQDQFNWMAFHPGVEVHWIYQLSVDGPAAAFIRFEPGGRVPLHEHRGFEHIFVMSGSQRDDFGHLAAGAFMIQAPGTRHSVFSEEGCFVLAVYEKPARFLRCKRKAPQA